MTGFNARQTAQLLAPIRPQRVLEDGKGHSHVSQQDITAHLIRVFGFGSFDTEVIKAECVYETQRPTNNGQPSGRWDVCYRALIRLTIRDEHGVEVCHFEDGSTAIAQNQNRGDGHDLAYKSALSLSKKRAAINLGDQFGLSLYNKGQMSALVIDTLVRPEMPADDDAPQKDLQAGIEQQVSLGNDETDYDAASPDVAAKRKALLDLLKQIAIKTQTELKVIAEDWFDQHGHSIKETVQIDDLQLFVDTYRGQMNQTRGNVA